jgi:phosphoglycerol geranylgeranyltransferase
VVDKNKRMQIVEQFSSPSKKMAILIDPDKTNINRLNEIVQLVEKAKSTDIFIFIGGSLMEDAEIDKYLQTIRNNTKFPIVLFPGANDCISTQADAFLLLSLISGRNPEWLISRHVQAASRLKKSQLEIISTSYILLACGKAKTVHYISNTQAIPSDKEEIAVATAMAGEMIGHQICYIEAGSGADFPAPAKLVAAVRNAIRIPLLVGGGIRTEAQMQQILKAGADVIVIGNAFEDNPNFLQESINLIKKYNKNTKK